MKYEIYFQGNGYKLVIAVDGFAVFGKIVSVGLA